MKLIPQIKDRRMEAHLSQKELAEIMEINQTQLSDYEKGKVSPSAAMLFRIAQAIGCKVDNLYEVVDD